MAHHIGRNRNIRARSSMMSDQRHVVLSCVTCVVVAVLTGAAGARPSASLPQRSEVDRRRIHRSYHRHGADRRLPGGRRRSQPRPQARHHRARVQDDGASMVRESHLAKACPGHRTQPADQRRRLRYGWRRDSRDRARARVLRRVCQEPRDHLRVDAQRRSTGAMDHQGDRSGANLAPASICRYRGHRQEDSGELSAHGTEGGRARVSRRRLALDVSPGEMGTRSHHRCRRGRRARDSDGNLERREAGIVAECELSRCPSHAASTRTGGHALSW